MSDCNNCGTDLAGKLNYADTSNGPRFCGDCWYDLNFDDIAQDAKIDRWHDGYFAKARPTDPDALEGWLHRRNEAPAVYVERPEGYYHMPLGSFD